MEYPQLLCKLLLFKIPLLSPRPFKLQPFLLKGLTLITTLPTSSSNSGISAPLPKLSSKQCWDSTLINCRYVHNPASICPTTKESLPASCTGSESLPSVTLALTTSIPAAMAPTPVPVATINVYLAFSSINTWE